MTEDDMRVCGECRYLTYNKFGSIEDCKNIGLLLKIAWTLGLYGSDSIMRDFFKNFGCRFGERRIDV